MRSKILISLILLSLCFSLSLFAQDQFFRSAVIPVPEIENGGFGNVVAGVDLDGDGKVEIYAVNNNWGDSGNELIPRIYKYELDGSTWNLVWSATLNIPLQNTWPALAAADLDKDGKGEIVWGPVNNTGGGNTNPDRMIVFEASGTDDVLGIPDGTGNFLPNSHWDMAVGLNPDNTARNMRPIKWEITDIDGDGTDEIIFPDRGGFYNMGIVSVNNIPDNGDGSETWTVEFTGKEKMENTFVRNGVIPGADGGFGDAVSGMDFDKDGLIDLYVVNDNWNDGPNGELVPTLYKYEFVNGAWVKRFETVIPGVNFQNTWPVLTYGDWDKDGKGDLQWCPVNNFGTGNEDPPRIVVYETPGDGSDVMGVDNGDGTYKPNAKWNFNLAPSTNLRPFHAKMVDIDGDGSDEFVFGERTNNIGWGVIGVSNIPDNGDGSETWTMEGSGTADGSFYRNVAVIGSTIYVFRSNGTVVPVKFAGGTYTPGKEQKIGATYPWHTTSTFDLNGDGTLEIIAGDYASGGSHSVWVYTVDADTLKGYKVADFSANAATQLTAVKVGDINGDGKADFVVGFRGTDEIYRVAFDGVDMTSASSYTISLLDKGVLGLPSIGQMDLVTLANIDGDASLEVIYGGIPRGVEANTQPLVIGDFGNWTLDGSSAKWDAAIVNGKIYVSTSGGNVASVYYDAASSTYKYGSLQSGLIPGGPFNAMCTGDVDNDGVLEIFTASYATGLNAAYMFKQMNGGLVAYKIADLAPLGSDRMTGGAAGDIDGDGNLDLVFGTRASTPNSSVYRVEYRGGDPTDIANWSVDLIDSDIAATQEQIDIIRLANVDEDPDLEIVYSGIPRGGTVVPIVILNLQKVSTTDIADVKVDANGDFQVDNIGQSFTVIGVVTSVNFTATSNRFSYYIQDATGGINVTKGSETGGGTVYQIGDKLQVTGTLGQFRGLVQLEIADLAADVLFLGVATPVKPQVVTIEELLADAEKYEGSLIQIKNVAKTAGSVAWPAAGSDANMTIWDGYMELVLRLDKDADLDDNTEPVYPMNVSGVVSQYTSSSTVYNDGYQISPSVYATDIVAGVKAPPIPYFFLENPQDGATVTLTDANQEVNMTWTPSIDLNGEALVYQLVILPNKFSSAALSTTSLALKASQIQGWMGTSDTVTFNWTVKTTDLKTTPVNSVDTFSVTFIDKIVDTGVEDAVIPEKFFVDQNYPNPFNPTTTIKFGLPEAANVDLRIYDILGREVAVLINNETVNAGVHYRNFNASSLASGTYVYRLTADKNTQIKKMLLLK